MENSNSPFLTIAIPTFNRAHYIDQCLGWVWREFAGRNDIEILVSDNCSTDNTEEVVKKYEALCSNLVYVKQKENIGFDKNIKFLLDNAKGRYVKIHGDDDLFNPGAIAAIIEVLKNNEDASLFFYHNGLSKTPYKRGSGYSEYIRSLRKSNGITFISSIIVEREKYNKIEEKEKYLESKIYQLYVQMEILKLNPNFCLIGGHLLSAVSGRAGRRLYNIAEVFIKSYCDILRDYIPLGLEESVLGEEMKINLDWIIIPLSREISKHGGELEIDNLEKLFMEYYKNEPYYEGKLIEIKEIAKK